MKKEWAHQITSRGFRRMESTFFSSHMSMCICAHVCKQMCIHVCGCQRSTVGVFFSFYESSLLRQDLSLNLLARSFRDQHGSASSGLWWHTGAATPSFADWCWDVKSGSHPRVFPVHSSWPVECGGNSQAACPLALTEWRQPPPGCASACPVLGQLQQVAGTATESLDLRGMQCFLCSACLEDSEDSDEILSRYFSLISNSSFGLAFIQLRVSFLFSLIVQTLFQLWWDLVCRF